MSGNGSGNWSGRTPGCGRGFEFVETSCGLLGAGVKRVMLYRFVDDQKAEGFPVRLTCSVVGVSPSAYYVSKQRPESGPAAWGRGCAGGRDTGDLAPVGWDLWFASGVRRAGSAGSGGESQAGGAADETPLYGGFRSPQAAGHHHRRYGSWDS